MLKDFDKLYILKTPLERCDITRDKSKDLMEQFIQK